MIIKKINDLDLSKETEAVIENIKTFYKLHKEECKKYYGLSKETNDIYSEIEDKDKLNKLLVLTSAVIITANMYEKNILHMRCDSKNIQHYQLNCFDNITCPININLYFLRIKDCNVLHLEAYQTGSYTIGGSADLVRFVFDNPYLKPQCIISFGICFGNDYRRVSLGDTIIAKKIYPYFISAKVNELELKVKDNNIFKIDSRLETRLQFLMEKNYFKGHRVEFDNLITGEAVISNSLIKKIFIEAATNQPVLGGEMEGYGLFKECQGYRETIPCLLVKSICDWGVAKNINEIDCSEDLSNIKDELQAYASYKAYDVLEKLLDEKSRIFKESIYEYIVSEIQKMKNRNVRTVYKEMLRKKVDCYTGDTSIVSEVFMDLLVDVLEDKKIIKSNKHVYNIL